MPTTTTLHRPVPRVGQASGLLLCFTLAAALPDLRAQTIPNPSFESNATFATAPGYVSLNAPITSWTASPTNRVGLNPAGALNDFADNGAIPNGTRVAFIQSDAGVKSTLSTTITGLTVGTSYRVQFRANRRSFGDAPSPSYRLNGGAPVSFIADPAVDPAGVHTTSYSTINGIFTATATTAALEISNTTATDSTLLVDNFTITAATNIQVTTLDNDGPGSLRQALATAAVTPAGNVITFAAGLNGQTITLLSKIVVNDAGGVIIDASSLSAGITLSGGDTTQILSVGSGSLLSLRKLTIARGAGEIFGAGGIFNEGTLSLAQCTLSDNFSNDNGGAIQNAGSLDLTQCTLSGNHAVGYGGAIYNYDFSLTLTQCTLSGNHADLDAGAIYNNGSMALTHCTISQNSATGVCQGVTLAAGTTIIANCIIAGHSAGDYDLLDVGYALSYVGANVIVDIYEPGSPGGPPPISTSPALDVLASNGGPTRTMALLPGSSARNAAVGSTIATDQRGKPKVGTADIGAFEIQSGGTFAFSQTGYSVGENASPAVVTVLRTGGFDGAASVKIASAVGTASAADFTAIPFASQTLGFADGEVSKPVNIVINNDAIAEANESFTVSLNTPSAGAALGPPATATVVILDNDSAPDSIAPGLPVISNPMANAVINLGANGTITVTGTATDDKGVGSVEILDFGDNHLADATLSAPSAASTGWTATITPVAGTQTIKVRSFDLGGSGGNPSAFATRTFKVLVPLAVQVAGNGSVTPAGFTPSSFREAGQKFTVTATPAAAPAPGSIFKNWEIMSSHTLGQLGIPLSALEKSTLNFIHREGLVLRANFVPSPYAFGANLAAPGLGTNSAGVSGVEYNGLIHANPLLPAPNGTVPNNSTEGLLTATVMSTGAFSGKLTIDGAVLTMAGAFDQNGVARFGTSRATTIAVARVNKPSLILELTIDLDPGRLKDTITGKVTAKSFQQSVTQAVSDVTADRAFYDGLSGPTTVPAAYLGAANATQSYTAVFPSRPPFNTVTVAVYGSSILHENQIIEQGGRLSLGDQIIFSASAPLGLTAGEVYTLVDDDDATPDDNYFSLKDSLDNFPDIDNSYNGQFFTAIVEHFEIPPADDPSFQVEQLDLTKQDFPQGDGYGLVTITKAGLVTLTTGKLADGTVVTGSSKLSKENTFPFFLQLYAKKGYLSGDVVLNDGADESDFSAVSLDWFRPMDITSQYYPFGWEEIIRVGFQGARYAATFAPASSVLRRSFGDSLLPADTDNGNAGLTFFDGQLTEDLIRTVSISTTNVVTKVPASDTSFALTLTSSTGLFSGTFVHENDDGGTGVPPTTAFEGAIFQKGLNAGGYGFFLTRKPTPIDYTGESGAVNLYGFEP